MGNLASKPYAKGKVTWHDGNAGVSVTENGQRLTFTRSTLCTVPSETVFSADSDAVAETFRVTELAGGMFGFGILPLSSSEACAKPCALGSADIANSISCIIGGGKVRIRIGGREPFIGNCDTSGTTNITIKIERGVASFRVDGREADCDALKQVRLSGRFRFGACGGRAGQEGVFRDEPAASGQLDLMRSLLELVQASEQRGPGDFHWKDIYSAVDVNEGGAGFVSKNSSHYTLHSAEAFDASSASVDEVLAVSELQGGLVAFGVFDANATSQCVNHRIGSSELKDSICCAVGNGQKAILYRGSPIFAAPHNTSGVTLVRLTMAGGHLRFQVDAATIDCPQLAGMGFRSTFRLGVSPSCAGQTGKLLHGDEKKLLTMLGDAKADMSRSSDNSDTEVTDCSAPHSTLTFADRLRSIDVVEGCHLVGRRSFKATCYTEQWFSGSMALRVTVRFDGWAKGPVGIGLLGKERRDECSDKMVGVIPDSAGLIVVDSNAAIVHEDKTLSVNSFGADPSSPVDITLVLASGKLSFEVKGRPVRCVALEALSFGSGRFRIGVSLSEVDQHAQVIPTASCPVVPPFTFTSSTDAITVSGLGHNATIEGRKAQRATAFTNETFISNANHAVSFCARVSVGHQSSWTGIGIAAADQTKVTGFLCGEKEISDSVGLLIDRSHVCVVQGDKFLSKQPAAFACGADEVDLMVSVREGRIRMFVDGAEFDPQVTSSLKLKPSTLYRFCVSHSQAGQRARTFDAVKRLALLPAPSSNFTWVPDATRAHRSGTTIESKAAGALCFTEEVVSTETYGQWTCDACMQSPVLSTRWKCTACEDFDLCNDCRFATTKQRHSHEADRFRPLFGTPYEELRFKLSKLLGGEVVMGVTPANQPQSFAAATPGLLRASTISWTTGGGEKVDAAPLRDGDEIWLRLVKRELTVIVNGAAVHRMKVPAGEYRFAILLCKAGQSAAMMPRVAAPARGARVRVVQNERLVASEARLTGASVTAGEEGTMVAENDDGTLSVCYGGGLRRTPRACVETIAAPAPLPTKNLVVGTKVCPNLAEWRWGTQSGMTSHGLGCGVVMSAPDGEGWIRVKWDSGSSNNYPASHLLAHVGAMGDRVVRNPAYWTLGDADGGGVGTVTAVRDGGVVDVQWPNGRVTQCSFGRRKQEVRMADEASVSTATTPLRPPPKPASEKVAPSSQPVRPPQHVTVSGSSSAPREREPVLSADAADVRDGLVPPPAIRLPPTYRPQKPLVELLGAATVLTQRVPLLGYILDEASTLATRRRDVHVKSNAIALDLDEALAIMLYSYDLQALSECPNNEGSDNFYYVVNDTMRNREPPLLAELKPFLYHFKKGYMKLPEQKGLYYRGVPSDAVPVVVDKYKPGTLIQWSSFTSASSNIAVARQFASKLGPGGIIFEIEIVSSRSLALYSAFPKEAEIVLEPSARFVVTGELSGPAADGHLRVKMQQVAGDAFVY